MFTTIKGVYNNGELTLEEKPDITQPMEVLVTFMKEVKPGSNKPIDFGFEKGWTGYPGPDLHEMPTKVKDYMY